MKVVYRPLNEDFAGVKKLATIRSACNLFGIDDTGVLKFTLDVCEIPDSFILEASYSTAEFNDFHWERMRLHGILENPKVRKQSRDELVLSIAKTGQVLDRYDRYCKISKFTLVDFSSFREAMRLRRPCQLDVQVGVRAQDFNQLGHYGPDYNSCFRDGRTNSPDKASLFDSGHAAVVLFFLDDVIAARSLLVRQHNVVYFTNSYVGDEFYVNYGFPKPWIGKLLLTKMFGEANIYQDERCCPSDDGEVISGAQSLSDWIGAYINDDLIGFEIP